MNIMQNAGTLCNTTLEEKLAIVLLVVYLILVSFTRAPLTE
jgi:hypothetical protein